MEKTPFTSTANQSHRRCDSHLEISSRLRLKYDGHAWTVTSLHRSDSEGSPARIVLVPYAPSRRESSPGARRHVRRTSNRRNGIVFSGVDRFAGARARYTWPFHHKGPAFHRFEGASRTQFERLRRRGGSARRNI